MFNGVEVTNCNLGIIVQLLLVLFNLLFPLQLDLPRLVGLFLAGHFLSLNSPDPRRRQNLKQFTLLSCNKLDTVRFLFHQRPLRVNLNTSPT